MDPAAFCEMIRAALTAHDQAVDEHWMRAAVGLCGLYEQVDAERFDLILTELARGDQRLSTTAAGRWLQREWRSAQRTPANWVVDTFHT